MLGDYYLERDEFEKAIGYYEVSLSKEIASKLEKNKIEQNLEVCH
jgi:hypothetical protein